MNHKQQTFDRVLRPRPAPQASSSSSNSTTELISQTQPSTSDDKDTRKLVDKRPPKKKPPFSLVEYYGSSIGFCGYCKAAKSTREPRPRHGTGGRHTFDMKAFALEPDDYQELLDRGWRRSGDYCYHPINSDSCCPNYSISCKTIKFKLSRSQRLCIENLNSFLVNGERNGANKLKLDYSKSNSTNKTLDNIALKHINKVHSRSFEELKKSNKMRHKRFVKSCELKAKIQGRTVEEVMAKSKERVLRKIYKHALLEDYLYPTREAAGSSPPPKLEHELKLKLINVESKICSELQEEENLIIQKYQKAIHKENPKDWSIDRFNDFLVESPLLVQPIRDRTYSNESNDSADETLSKKVYYKDYILVEPPNLPTHYGTYHCVYLLDDMLIAVGVLDILPKCVTTVYFFYDPQYEFLNLGIYSALVEISMTRQITEFYSKSTPIDPLVHYYLGYYVHECKKMHYKTQFHPSYLLCSETFIYVPTKPCLEKLKKKKYARFCLDPNNQDSVYNEPPQVTAKNVTLISAMTPVTNTLSISDYRKWLLDNFGRSCVETFFDCFIHEYARMVGMPLVSRMRLKIHSLHRALEARSDKHQSNHQDCGCAGDH